MTIYFQSFDRTKKTTNDFWIGFKSIQNRLETEECQEFCIASHRISRCDLILLFILFFDFCSIDIPTTPNPMWREQKRRNEKRKKKKQ